MQQTELQQQQSAAQDLDLMWQKKKTRRFVSKKIFHLLDERGEERRSDVVRIQAVMFHSGGVERQMRRIVKRSQTFQSQGKSGR